MIAIKAAGILLTAFAVSVTAALNAAEVSLESAKAAAQAWIDLGYSMDCLRGRSAAEGETLESDGAKMHVVSLDGGGFIVMGADDLVQPVVAFSPNGEAHAHDAKSPLWKILKADMAMRVRAEEAASAGGSAVQSRITLLKGAASSSRTETQRLWDSLLGGGASTAKSRMRLLSSTPDSVEAVSDVRVAPLVKSRWGQSNNSIYSNVGDPCYNYYTPNNYPCGCVATVLAQIMRFHRFPLSVSKKTKSCKVGTASMSMTMMDGDCDYDNMPLVPEAYSGVSWYEGGASEEQRKAIGKLTYNCGVAMRMWWGKNENGTDVSAAGGEGAASVLTGDFGYANAVVCACKDDLADASFRNRIICSNLDAGFPVILGIVAHEVIADGYGYSGETLYTHINLGWSGADDVWYALPTIATPDGWYKSEFVESVIYNIFPSSPGEIVSGRVLDDDGNPVVGACVTIIPEDSTATVPGAKMTTGETGIFSFVVPGDKSYVVNAVGDGIAATREAKTGKSASSRVTLNTGYCDIIEPTESVACGNVWGCDLVLAGLRSVATPVVEPNGGVFYPVTNVTISCLTDGATIRYTTDGTDPTERSEEYAGAIGISSSVTFKVRAFKEGYNPSPIVVADFRCAPEGVFYAKPIDISGVSGDTGIFDISAFLMEDGEPNHTDIYECRKSCWFRWQAPKSGILTLKAKGVLQGYLITAVAVYPDSDEIPKSTDARIAMSETPDEDGAATLSFSVVAGTTYRIVGVALSQYEIRHKLGLSWDLEIRAVDLDARYVLKGGVAPDFGNAIAAMTANGWRLSVSGLPQGMFYDESIGVLKGAATQEGDSTVVFTTTRGSDVLTYTTVFRVVFPEVQVAVVNKDGRASVQMGSVTGAGRYPVGKKITLKAIADKGYLFCGYFSPTGGLLEKGTTYSFDMPADDVDIEARFMTLDDDKESIKLFVDGAACSPNVAQAWTRVCGVALEWRVSAEAFSTTTIKVSGLPTGLKFTAKDILKKGSKTEVEIPANTIYGAPSAASKVDARNGKVTPSRVVFTVTTANKSSQTFVVELYVDPLPAWAIGNFEGGVVPGGVATMSVAASGKISGKISHGGVNWTFKADSFSAMECPTATTVFQTNFIVSATATAGKEVQTVRMSLSPFAFADLPCSATAMASGAFGNDSVSLYRLVWADKGDAKAAGLVATYAGAFSLTVAYGGAVGDLTLTLDEKGVLKGSAVLPDGAKTRKASVAANALVEPDGIHVVIYVAPDAKKGYALIFEDRILIPHSGDDVSRYAFRNPGVITVKEPLYAGSSASGTVSVTPKYGQTTVGKPVTLKATAAKGSVFAGWYDGETLLSQASSYAFPAPTGDKVITAKFITVDEDKRGIKFAVAGEAMSSATSAAWVNICGVAVNWPVFSEGLSETAVKVAGLPAGLKLVQDKVTKAYSVAGVPTAASKVDREGKVTPAKVVFTVTTAGKSSQVFVADWTILPLPDWACGTFDGASFGEGNNAVDGLVQALTVAANGKISGKVVNYDGTWTLSAASFDNYDDITKSFKAVVTCKCGQTVSSTEVTVAANGARGIVSFGGCVAWQNQWKTAEWKNVATGFAKAPVLTSGEISFKFASTGVVTAGGKFLMGKDARGKDIVYSASCSSPLIPVVNTGEKLSTSYYRIFLFFPPKAGKFDGYATEVPLVWNGASFTLPE